jgi:hypothetical protein
MYKKGEGGRPKGVKNTRTRLVEEIASRFKLDPFEVLLMITNNDWKGLGYASETQITGYSPNGDPIEQERIKLADRVQAAKEASKYLYSQKQAVALSAGETGLVIKVLDYTTKDLPDRDG